MQETKAKARRRRPSDRRWVALAVVLLVVDSALLIAHVAHHLSGRAWPETDLSNTKRTVSQWDGGLDGSFIELFGHLQLSIAAILLMLFATRFRGQSLLVVWALVFISMTVDDYFRVHEQVGELLDIDRVGSGLTGRGAQEIGGLVFWAVAVTVLGAALLVAYYRSSPNTRACSKSFAAILSPLFLVAVGYVALSAYNPNLIENSPGILVAHMRVAVKLLTMSSILIYVTWLIHAPSMMDDGKN